MSTPLVDVVVPLHNKAEVVARTVLSVLGQSVGTFRLTVVDDGSTDGGVDRVPVDPRITLVRQANAGPGKARNAGLRRGKAPFVAFLDADDEWLPDFLATTLRILQGQPDCAAVGVSWFRGPGRESQVPRHASEGIATGPWRCPVDLSPELLKHAVDFCASSAVLARRQAVERLGGFYDRGHATYGEDSFLWLRLLMQEPMYRLLEPLVWIHTDHSALSAGRRTPYPVPPILDHVDEVVAECPASHRALLQSYLPWYALVIAHRLAEQGEGRSAGRVLRRGERACPAGDLRARALYDRTCLLARLWLAVRLRNAVRRRWPGFTLRPWKRQTAGDGASRR